MQQDSQEEIWKDIPGYEGLYQVSSTGQVKGLKRMYFNPLIGSNTYHKERIFKLASDAGGYKRVCLTKGKSKITHKVHRLVATAFIPNPKNKPQVNHINGIKSDNTVSNLEWATCSENISHAFRHGLTNYDNEYHRNRMIKINKSRRKPVTSIEPNGNTRNFKSCTEAGLYYGLTRGEVSKVCIGKKRSAKEIKFKYP